VLLDPRELSHARRAERLELGVDFLHEHLGGGRAGGDPDAPAPEVLVQEVVSRLKALGAASVRQLAGVEEHVVFPMPKGLQQRPPGPAASGRG